MQATAQTTALKVVAWGEGGNYAIVPDGLSNVVAIHAGQANTMVLKANGAVAGWGRCHSCNGEIPGGLTDATAVSIGGFNVLALRQDGTVLGWGDDYFGETIVPAGLTSVVAIATGHRQSLALRSDGTVVMWGQHGSELPANVQDLVAISAGKAENYFHALGLKRDGTVVTWGRNDYGEDNVPAGLSNVVAISAGSFHNVALRADGTVVAWGGKDAQIAAPPPGVSNVVAISAGELHNLALKSDGTIVSWQSQSLPEWWKPVPEGLTNVSAISAGRFHSVALVGEQAPIITQQPQSFQVPWGANTGNEVKVIGTEPIFFQWQKDGVDLASGTNRFLGLSNVDFSDSGTYSVIVSNFLGSVTSDSATMTVIPWIDILEHPLSQSVNAGDDVTFFVTVRRPAAHVPMAQERV